MSDQPIRVLLVEDNPTDVLLIDAALLGQPTATFAITAVECLAAARQHLGQTVFDVVLLDLDLPDSLGLTTLLALLAHVPQTPIIVLTGLADEALGLDALQAGAQDYLVKGQVAGSELARAIRYAIERKRMAAALRASEARLNGIVGAALDGIIAIDATQRIGVFNAAAEQLFGCPAAAALGQPIDRFIPALSYMGHAAALHTFGQNAVTSQSTRAPRRLTALRADGVAFPIAATIVQTVAAEQPLYTVIVRDITAGEQAAAALRQSEQQYRLHFETMLHGSVYHNDSGQIIAMNPAAERILGRNMDELGGSTSEDLEHATLREDGSPFPGAEHPAIVALRTGQPVPNVLMQVFNPREQRYRWITISAVPLFTQDTAQPDQVYAIFEDVTDRKHAELAMQESQDLLRTATNTAQVGLVIIDREHRYRYANPTYAALYYLPTAEIVGQRVADVLAPVYESQIRPRLERAFGGERVSYELAIPLVVLGGAVRHYAVTYEPVVYRAEPVMVVVVVDITERKRAEEQTQYQADLLAQVSDAIISTDASFTIKSWNAAAEALYGWPAQDVIGRPMSAIVPTEYQDSDERQVLARFLREGRWRGEVVQRHKDGTPRTILSSVSLLKDSAGAPVGAVAVNRDITERKRAEVALERSAARLRVLADASRAFTAVGADYQALLDQIAQTTATVLGEGCHIRLLSSDGIWLQLGALYDRDDEKRELARIILSDAPLRLDEPTLARILKDGQSLLIPVVDLDQARAATKPEFWVLADRLGIHSMIIVPIYVHGQTIGLLRLYRYQRDQPPFDTDDLTLAQDLADRAALAISNARLLQAVQHELTERTKAEAEVRALSADLEQRVIARTAELVAANKELEAFSYSVSHDLRSPLRAIDGFSRILLEDYVAALPDDAQRYFQLIRDNAQQMGRLVDDLLAFSRLGRQPLSRRSVDPSGLVHQCLDDLRAEQAGRTIDVQIGTLLACMGDAALLKQVWINLLENALKYTRRRDPAVIVIGCKVMGQAAVYFVKDNGVGFDMRYSDKLFGVFQRMHRAEDYEGTGVGLAIVERIIHRHGGRIWAEAAVDQGATFFFTLGETLP